MTHRAIRLPVVTSLILAVLAMAGAARAANKYFDTAASGSTWDTAATANWGTAPGGPYTSTWASYDRATFEGTGGAVTLSDPYANWLVFDADGYTLTGSTLHMGNPGGTNNFQVNPAYTATIASDISQPYATGINKRGAGTLILTGNVSSSAGNNRAEEGTLELGAGGTLAGNMWIADSDGTTGRFLVSGGTFNSTGVTVATRGNGTFDITGGVANLNGGLYLGHAAGTAARTATVNVDGGTVAIGGNIIFANANTCSALFNQTAGDVTFTGGGYFYMGNMGAATQEVNLSGGTLNASNTGGTLLAIRGTASLNVSNTADVTLRDLGIGHVGTSGATGIVNLDGGMLTVGRIYENTGGHVSTVNLNGGTLRASGDQGAFMQGLDAASVLAGGAVIDTQSYDIAINQPLLDGGGNGGLTKLGSGTLTLSGNNTYTGTTAVNDGVLQVNSPASLPGAASVNAPGTLRLAGNNGNWSNTITGDGTLNVQFGTGGGNTYLSSGVNGFTGTIELTRSGATTGDKLRSDGINAPGADLLINPGTQLFVVNAGTFKSIAVSGTGNTENRGAIRMNNGTLNGPISLLGDTTIGTANSTITGPISSGAAGTQTLTLGAPSQSGGTVNLTGVIGGGLGTIAFSKQGTGDVVLTGPNTYSGGTTVQAGRLRTNSATGYGSGPVTVPAGGEAYLYGGVTVGNTFLISGDGGNSMDTQLRGAIRLDGGTIASSGSVILEADASLGTYNNNTGTIQAVIGESGGTRNLSINKSGANAPGTIVLSGNNTYTGTTTIEHGTLVLNTPNFNTYHGSDILINNGSTLRITRSGGANRYDFVGKTIAFGATGGGTIDTSAGVNLVTWAPGNTIRTTGGAQNRILGTSGFNVNAGTALTFDVAPGSDTTSDLTMSARVWNTGSVIKTGAGTMTMTAASTYSGGTNVNGGTLLVNNATGAGTGTGAVNVSGTGVLGGTGTTGGDVNNNAGGRLSPGGDGAIGRFTVASLANVSQGQPATQSSEYNNGQFPAGRGVDGNTGNFTHTAATTSDPWWEVDLGAEYRIDHLMVWNRTDCCGDRIDGWQPTIMDAGMNTVFGPASPARPSPNLAVDTDGVVGQYVHIALPGSGKILSLGEVQVMALQAANYTQADGAELTIETDGNGVSDILAVLGDVNLDGTLNVLFAQPTSEMDSWLILDNMGPSPIDGTFTDLPEGAVFYADTSAYPLQISYRGGDGNDVTLTAVPEPVTMGLLTLGALGLGGYLRRRRKA